VGGWQQVMSGEMIEIGLSASMNLSTMPARHVRLFSSPVNTLLPFQLKKEVKGAFK